MVVQQGEVGSNLCSKAENGNIDIRYIDVPKTKFIPDSID
jgi:hypothetical protein